jgi:glucose-6-phosphate 1-dehydrogenase
VGLPLTPQRLFADAGASTAKGNYVRFRLSPNAAIALAARVKLAGQQFVGEQRELYLLDAQPGEEAPYERLLTDAMAGDGALFAREDAVEAAWAVVNPILTKHHRSRTYRRDSWGPQAAETLIAKDGPWHVPDRKCT